MMAPGTPIVLEGGTEFAETAECKVRELLWLCAHIDEALDVHSPYLHCYSLDLDIYNYS
jgi:hypothetical protein